jgi:hypothetical protein
MARTRLLEATAALTARLDSMPPSGVSAEPNASIVDLLTLVGEVRRAVDAIGSELAAQIDRRSTVPESSLARSMGDRTPAIAVARIVGIDQGEALDWVRAGEATAARLSLSGEPLPPQYPSVAESLGAGKITPRAARTIVDALDALAPLCSGDEVAQLEQLLLTHAPQLTTRELAKLCRQAVDRFDPDGAEPREDRLRERSGITVVLGRDGLVTWIVKMHPEAAGFLTAAIDARTAPRRVPTFVDANEADIPTADDRTLAHKRLDALVDIARESLGRDDGRLAGTAVTVCVTMTLDALLSGIGDAHIDGIDAPISAATARRLAADAAIIPIVLGGASEPLDVGRSSRLFSETQRRALGVRDGGCIWGGCEAPPGWCEVAHLIPWSHDGPTDLANGALMCHFHHRRFDNDGWQLRWEGGVPWLIPPAWLDASRAPRRAGRLPRVA